MAAGLIALGNAGGETVAAAPDASAAQIPLAATAVTTATAATAAAPPAPGAAATATAAGQRSRPDSSAAFPARLPDQEPWERWVNLPGTVLWFLPDLAMRGAGAAIGYVDDEKIIPKIHRVLVSEDGTRAVLPAYSVLTGSGVVYKKKELVTEGSRLSLLGAVGPDWRHEAAFAFRELRVPGGLRADLVLDYHLLSEEAYFGTGPRTKYGDGTGYSHMRLAGEWSLASPRRSGFTAEAKGSLVRDDVLHMQDDDFPALVAIHDETTAPGMVRPIVMAGAGLELRFDSYASPDPHGGGELRASAALHNDIGDEPYAFWKLGAGAGYLVPIAYGRKLFLRLEGEKTLPMEDRRIPFYQLSQIGRDGTVRGFARGRFRDRDALWGSAEYRWPIWTPHFRRALEFLLFADGGQVGHDLPREFDWDLMQYGFGGGLRYYGDEGLIARLELGVSREQYRFYFKLN